MDRLDFVASEDLGVEGENPSYAVDVHGCATIADGASRDVPEFGDVLQREVHSLIGGSTFAMLSSARVWLVLPGCIRRSRILISARMLIYPRSR